ncbi:DNA maturase A [Burkholderia phage JG068]|uniref:DNA maturase A n=1 Tax=Burkholderia phage JG068 TaxID=1401297 RepID=U3PIR1_9CAUD|nr:terminase small subunit [Burkholderia phage JG068]AGW43625.1 DNA maturase A [Burkholderia phage JG068]
MSDLTSLLEQLHCVAVEELLQRIRSGDASAADLGVAVQLLKHNSITADTGKNDSLAELRERLQARQAANINKRQGQHTIGLDVDDALDHNNMRH